MSTTIGKLIADGGALPIDIERLVETRLLLQANSGAGKSWALRRLLEQTHGAVQHIVLDVEDEFHTLRERYDYVLAGRHGGDCPADVKSAPLLARRLLELGVSAVIGLFELRAHERLRFVRVFLDALISAPRELWHPALVVIDEAHIFAPQTGNAESQGAVIDLMTRGRKRGFCGVLATQRISKLHKDAAAEANNKLIGRSALDVDMRRAADELGFTTREQQQSLRTLQPGHFFAFGPALSDQVVQVAVAGVNTTHPRAGQRAAPPPPPQERVRKVLAQLADLPREAEEEVQTVEGLRAEIRDLKRQLRAAPKAEQVEKRIEVPVSVVTPQDVEILDAATQAVEAAGVELRAVIKSAAKALDRVAKGAFPFGLPPTVPSVPAAKAAARIATARTVPTDGVPVHDGMSGPEQRILDAVRWLEAIGNDKPEVTAVAFIAGYRANGGAFNNPRGRLHARGLVEYLPGKRMTLTGAGRELASRPAVEPTNEGLHDAVLGRLDGPERRILQPLLDAYPEPMAIDELAVAAGYEPRGGAFNNPRGRLRSLGLIDYPQPGHAVARAMLFPEGA